MEFMAMQCFRITKTKTRASKATAHPYMYVRRHKVRRDPIETHWNLSSKRCSSRKKSTSITALNVASKFSTVSCGQVLYYQEVGPHVALLHNLWKWYQHHYAFFYHLLCFMLMTQRMTMILSENNVMIFIHGFGPSLLDTATFTSIHGLLEIDIWL